ncbi:MAG: outer membrane protein assembly factor BamD [Proteobacteria bacterium]|nr:outer membrane protein assembly factor BamD [Pseudomonadota bacterium]
MVRRLVLTTAWSITALIATSCFWVTTKEEGHQLRTECQHLKDRIDQIENELEEKQWKLKQMIDRARTDMVKLEETLTRATRVLARNSADFGAEIVTVQDKLREIDGSLAEITHELEESGKAIDKTTQKVTDFALAAGVDMPVDQSKIPKQPGDHVEMIKSSLASGRYGEVRSLSKVFLQRYPKHDSADDVQLLIAKSYLDQKRWAKALGALRWFTDKYPKSELTPEVLYEMAHAFFSLGDCTDARILVEAITTRHKKSPFANKAKGLGEEMKKNKSRCTS